MTTWTLLDRLFQSGIRAPTVLLANAAIALRGRDSRHFHVDPDGNWVNRQCRATFVSPSVHSARYTTVKRKVLDHWCHTYTPRTGDVVFDIGAGIGDDAVIFSHLVSPGGRTYLAEAHPRTFACLQNTVDQSRLTNATLLPCAIMDQDGSISISSGDHLSNSVLEGGDVVVPARSLSSICAEHGVRKIDFLKMNIEGAERLAVQGFGSIEIPHLAISCHDFVADAGHSDTFRTRDFVRRFLVASGYTVTQRSDHPMPWVSDTLYADIRRPH